MSSVVNRSIDSDRERAELICLQPGTCSERATLQLIERDRPHASITHVATFEDGLEMLKSGACPQMLMLLPHVHHLARAATLDDRLELVPRHAFWLANPPLYLAGRVSGASRCACIPDLRPLLLPTGVRGVEFVDAPNTQVAAQMVASGDSDLCITNEAGVERFGLPCISQLKKMDVYWIPVRKSGGV